MLAPHIIIDEEDFRSLCQRVASNDETSDIVSLTTSSRSDNEGARQIGFVMMDQDVRDLAQALAQNTAVTELYINITRISVRGAIALMPYIISSKTLGILGLQGKLKPDWNFDIEDDDDEDDDFELENRQVVAIEVLIRAAVQNRFGLTLELQSCPVARSSLRVCFQPNSYLCELSVGAGNCQMIEDDEDLLADGLVYSTKLQEVTIVQNDGDKGLSNFLFQCCVHLPCLEKIYIGGNCSVPAALSQVHTLQDVSYMNESADENPDAISSLTCFIENADSLNRLFLQLVDLAEDQIEGLRLASEHNRSLTHIWQSPRFCKKLSDYSRRNAAFLTKWQDLRTEIEDTLFPFAAEVATKSNIGRSSLYLRLPQILSRE
ncbi:unnamed protein product [Cylindrotheca closterium]|uniref:Uncharacterized protein n=1 Tax=Cylindrotheca closterium TaxID=2856 RepID=A0AAD2CRH5_9STRA|nr:unnamed protein product [Cylindrotheca closterium]